MPFNSELPDWKKDNPDPTPTQEKKDRGWVAGERPPASMWNWFANRTYRALKQLFENAIHKETLGKPGGPAKLDDNGKLVAGQENTQTISDASTEQKGVVQLSDATNSNSTLLAATANAVKKVYDLAFAKYSKPSTGIPKTDLDANVRASLTSADNSIRRTKLAEVNFTTTPAASGEFVIPAGFKKVIIEGVLKMGSSGNAQLILNDIVTNSYITPVSNYPYIPIFSSATESAVYIEIDALSPRLLTRVAAVNNYMIAQLLPAVEVNRLQKIKITAVTGGTSNFVGGTVAVWGEPI